MSGICRDSLHELLWEQRYDGDLVTVVQTELADKLAVNKATINRVMKKMADEQRLEPAGDQIYRVFDPALRAAEPSD